VRTADQIDVRVALLIAELATDAQRRRERS